MISLNQFFLCLMLSVALGAIIWTQLSNTQPLSVSLTFAGAVKEDQCILSEESSNRGCSSDTSALPGCHDTCVWNPQVFVTEGFLVQNGTIINPDPDSNFYLVNVLVSDAIIQDVYDPGTIQNPCGNGQISPLCNSAAWTCYAKFTLPNGTVTTISYGASKVSANKPGPDPPQPFAVGVGNFTSSWEPYAPFTSCTIKVQNVTIECPVDPLNHLPVAAAGLSLSMGLAGSKCVQPTTDDYRPPYALNMWAPAPLVTCPPCAHHSTCQFDSSRKNATCSDCESPWMPPYCASQWPSPSPTPVSPSPTPSASSSPSCTPSISLSKSKTPSISRSSTPSSTPTKSVTPSHSPTPSPSSSLSKSPTPSKTRSNTPTPSPCCTATHGLPSPASSPSTTRTRSPSMSLTPSSSSSGTPTLSPSLSPSPSAGQAPSGRSDAMIVAVGAGSTATVFALGCIFWKFCLGGRGFKPDKPNNLVSIPVLLSKHFSHENKIVTVKPIPKHRLNQRKLEVAINAEAFKQDEEFHEFAKAVQEAHAANQVRDPLMQPPSNSIQTVVLPAPHSVASPAFSTSVDEESSSREEEKDEWGSYHGVTPSDAIREEGKRGLELGLTAAGEGQPESIAGAGGPLAAIRRAISPSTIVGFPYVIVQQLQESTPEYIMARKQVERSLVRRIQGNTANQQQLLDDEHWALAGLKLFRVMHPFLFAEHCCYALSLTRDNTMPTLGGTSNQTGINAPVIHHKASIFHNEMLARAGQRFLLHGTSSHDPLDVAVAGLDKRYSRPTNYYGPGLYFTDNLFYVHNGKYCKHSRAFRNKTYRVLLCSVLIGNYQRLHNATPETTEVVEGGPHRTCSGLRCGSGTMWVVRSNPAVYPAYIAEYTRPKLEARYHGDQV